MRRITKEELQKKLELHKQWINGDGGERLKLRNADLSGAYLIGADLRCSDLSGSDLSGAYLIGADLRCSDLSGADLRCADLSGAYLRWAITDGVRGLQVISVQVDTSRINNRISYWVDLDVWTTGCFQGNLEKLKESVEKTHSDNTFLRERYYRVIDFILNEAKVKKMSEEEK